MGFVWRRPWMTQRADTYGASVLAHLGWTNPFGDAPDRYPETDLDVVRALAPDLVVLPSEPYPFRDRHRAEVAGRVPGARVVTVDGRDLFWWGIRTPGALAVARRACSRPGLPANSMTFRARSAAPHRRTPRTGRPGRPCRDDATSTTLTTSATHTTGWAGRHGAPPGADRPLGAPDEPVGPRPGGAARARRPRDRRRRPPEEPFGLYTFLPGDPEAALARWVEQRSSTSSSATAPSCSTRSTGATSRRRSSSCVLDHRRRVPAGAAA